MPISTTGGGGSNLVVAAMAAQYLQLLLADRTTLRGHPALRNAAFGLGGGSLTKNFASFGLDGYQTLPAVAEGVDASEMTLTTALSQLSVARRAGTRKFTDEISFIDPTGQINYTRLAQSGFMEAMVTLTSLIAGLSDNFTTQVGTTGVAMDHDLFKAAKKALNDAGVPGPYLCFLPLESYSNWADDLETRGGVTQWRAATAEQQALRGPGFKGVYDDIEIFALDSCPTSGSDKIGSMFGAGAIIYGEQEVGDLGPAAVELLRVGPIVVEASRNAAGGVNSVVTNYRVGAAIADDARGVSILAAA